MNISSVSAIWNALKAELHFSKQHLLECEPEIQVLLQCVDAYVQKEKENWDKEKQNLIAKFAIPEQEYLIQKTTLTQKNHEIGKLRSALEYMEKHHQEIVTAYERELLGVKNETARLWRDHEKLEQKHEQCMVTDSTGKSQHDEDEIQFRKLSRKLEEYRQRSLEWEHEKRALQKQLEVLQSENKILNERNELSPEQFSNNELELQYNKSNGTSVNLSFQLEQLQNQLDKAQDSISSQDKTITCMKMMLEESMTSLKQTLHEKEQLECELRNLQEIMRVTKAELCAVKMENRQFRQDAVTESGGNLLELDKTEPEHHLLCSQANYTESVKTLKIQNDRLEKDLSFVKYELQEVEENMQAEISLALLDRDKAIQQMKDAEKKRVFELSELNKRQMEIARSHFCETLHQFEAKIEELQKKIFTLEDELQLKDTSLAKLGKQNEAVTSFINGINHVIKSPVVHIDSETEFGKTSSKLLSSQITDFFSYDDMTIDSTEVATEEFRQFHEANNQELENKLNFLIQKIETVTDNTIRKSALLSDCSPKPISA